MDRQAQAQHSNNAFYKAHLTLVDHSCALCVLFFFFHFCILFSLTSLCHLLFFLLPLSHFPSFLSPSFLRSALLLIFCPTHEVLLPEGVFKLHPEKRHHKTSAQASHNSPNAISSDFVCMIRGGVFLAYLVNPEPFLFIVAHTFNLMLLPRFSCSLTYKR